MRLAGGNGDTEGCRWAVWGSPTLLPHTSHRLSPSEPPCRSACRRRGRKVSPGRTHRRGSPARAPRSHVPSSRQTEPVSGGCLAHKHLPPRRQGKTQLLVRTAKQCLVSDSPAAGKEKKILSLDELAVLQGGTLHHPSPTVRPAFSCQGAKELLGGLTKGLDEMQGTSSCPSFTFGVVVFFSPLLIRQQYIGKNSLYTTTRSKHNERDEAGAMGPYHRRL